MERQLAGILHPIKQSEIRACQDLRKLERIEADSNMLKMLMESYGIDVKGICTVQSGLSFVTNTSIRNPSLLIAAGIDLDPYDRVLAAAKDGNIPVVNVRPAPHELGDMKYQVFSSDRHLEVWYDPDRNHGLQVAVQTMMREEEKIMTALGRTR